MARIGGRRSIRMPGFDYAAGGVFFVTVCTAGRRCLSGEIVDGAMKANELGRTAENCWRSIASHRENVEIDAFAVMPNHLHGVLRLASVGATLVSPAVASTTAERSHAKGIRPATLGSVIGCFKSDVARRASALGFRDGVIWQRNYYEHLVRDDASLERIRDYIAANPARWDSDPENPTREATRLPVPVTVEPWCV